MSRMDVGPTLHRVWQASRRPLLVAGALSAYAVFADREASGAVSAHYRIPLWMIVGLYLIGAVATGLVWGAGREWATTRFRGAVLGFVTAAIAAVPVTILVVPQPGHGPVSLMQVLVAMLLFGLFPGSYVGAIFWKSPQDRTG